jgi:hypothetical protein
MAGLGVDQWALPTAGVEQMNFPIMVRRGIWRL